MKPITPEKVKQNFGIPDIALGIINKLIIDHFTGIESIFTKEKLKEELLECGYNYGLIESIINKIPKIYKSYGWNVEETEAGFIFTELLN